MYLYFKKLFSVDNLYSSSLTLFCSGSPQCYVRFDYVDRLLLTTLAPLAIEVLLGLCFVLHIAWQRRRGWREDESDFHAIVSTYVSFFLVVTYLILPRCVTERRGGW